ncbi:MAG: RNA polymerase sporulation sigma factor SigE [Clostridia bacterium]|nr:RNA polymerase sporulation sigma factor SigE [Clostridia bacterium]MBR2645657.1 RNA polymerase sporulation sigma factor SigE [Clostridia bacterium]MBR3037470.1 RNA polymerase sporulation sigma factor SigE [Clostridia bacterium]
MIKRLLRIWSRLLLRLHVGRRTICWYIHTNEGLPAPLDPEEEARCIALAPTDREAKDKLIVHNLRLVVYLARKFENTGVQTEDLISIGTIGLIKAVETFKSEKKIKLATYASRCIENEILMHLRRTTKLKLEVSFEEPLNVDWDGNELLLEDILGTDPDVVSRDMEDEAERDLLNRALAKLSDRERDIIDLRFGLRNGEAQTQKQVADAMGISQSYISRLEKRIMKRLKRDLLRMQS